MSLSFLSPIKTPAQLADQKAPWPDKEKVAQLKAMPAAKVAAGLDCASRAPDWPPAPRETVGEMASVAAKTAAAAAEAEHIASAGKVEHERVEAADTAEVMCEAAEAAAARKQR